MEFIRTLSMSRFDGLDSDRNKGLFNRLKADVSSGKVFPAVRVDELHFYYKGGLLYNYCGRFTRNKAYGNGAYDEGTQGLDFYEKAKKQNENKFTNVNGGSKERLLLDGLYGYTFTGKPKVAVIDIEVNLNGGKKCDLVLYNNYTQELMFVEGKVFSDRRVNTKCGYIPEVIAQVNGYSQSVEKQEQRIIEQYGEHISIVNRLFGSRYNAPNKVIKPAKLIVYECEFNTQNRAYSRDIIESALGGDNVLWLKKGEQPKPEEIWERLCGYGKN